MRAPVVAVAVLAASLCSGCGTTRIRGHGRTDVPAHAVAVVVCPGSLLEYVLIERVDGAPVDRRTLGTTEVEVLPGRHTFEVGWVRGSFVRGTFQSTTNATLVLDAEAGHRYVVKAAEVPEDFWAEVEKVTLGGIAPWTAWIEDATTKAVVSGRPPGTDDSAASLERP